MKKEKIVILKDTDKMIRWINKAVDYMENCVHMGEEGQGILNDGRDILAHYREKHEENHAPEDGAEKYMKKQNICRKCKDSHTQLTQEPCLSCTYLNGTKVLKKPSNFRKGTYCGGGP